MGPHGLSGGWRSGIIRVCDRADTGLDEPHRGLNEPTSQDAGREGEGKWNECEGGEVFHRCV